MKIIQISDLHFGLHHPYLVEIFLKDLEEIKPDIIIVSGDLTSRAKSAEYEELLKFLHKLPAQVLVVPGNHDISLWNTWARILNPFKKYNSFITPHFNSEFHNDECRILGVNSVNPFKIKDGLMSLSTLRTIKNYFEPSFNGLDILFMHHNFGFSMESHKPLQNYQQFLDYLKNSSINIVCTGHLHYATEVIIEKKNKKPCLLLHAGSLLCTRSKDGLNSYFVIETNKFACQVYWRVFENNQFKTKKTSMIDFNNPFFNINNDSPS